MVTVDLLTTGIDVPEITKLVFLRRVKSRILFEQMLGRATRLYHAIKKDHFDIYDAVQIYDAIASNMKHVTSNPAISLVELIDTLKEVEDGENKVLSFQLGQIEVKLQRKRQRLMANKEEQFISMTQGRNLEQYIQELVHMDAPSAKKKLLEDREIFVELEKKSGSAYTRPIIVDNHADKITEHTRNYGTGKRPEDYIEEFAALLREI